ncbi:MULTISPECIES: DUF6018 family natural product bioysynthesis protein [Bacillus]|uniref:DUF6018 family natural product bioysynthesis protein n=1 Tax=Bacillus TaxID=1386 RepID=UPI00006B595E|nr:MULTISPECIES: DUF6018 family natural product bioysynthesis protein [unclassified Bacillus (in: firmicutes)]EAR66197.1 hypothetical protein B14911_10697 [Bacillus sp. NRRL B-14911]
MAKVLAELFNEGLLLGDSANCRYYRMEIRTPDGKKRIYSLKENSKSAARFEAQSIVEEMINSFEDERIMWKMTGDKHWNFGAAKTRKSISKKLLHYFFGEDIY